MKLSGRALSAFAAMALAAGLAQWARPTISLAELRGRIDLDSQMPAAFAGWAVDRGIVPLLPNPELQARLDALYTQVFAKTYIHRDGQRVMVSIAYGSDQGSEATAVHRPEFCYSAHGFSIAGAGQAQVNLGGNRVGVRRLVASQGRRIEAVSYWVTLDESAVLPGWQRRLAQLRYGLRGEIPDGMLVRVSALDADPDAAFRLQEGFLRELYQHMDPKIRFRYFGRQAS